MWSCSTIRKTCWQCLLRGRRLLEPLLLGCRLLGRRLAAGLRVAELLGEVGGQLGEEQRAVLPSAMGRFVISDLRAAVMT